MRRRPRRHPVHFRASGHGPVPATPLVDPQLQSSAHSTAHRALPSLKIFLWLGILICLSLMGWWFFHRSWRENQINNILIVYPNLDGHVNEILFAHVSPQDSRVTVVTLPAELPVTLIGGYGKYPLRSVFPLLALDHQNDQFIRSVYSLALGTIIDQVWVVPSQQASKTMSFRERVDQALTYQLSTPLSFQDRVWLSRFVHGLRPDQLTEVRVTDDATWRKAAENIHYPAEARDCSVAIVNTTSAAGLGSQVAGVVKQSGFAVIRLADAPTPLQKSKVVLPSSTSCREVSSHLKQLFPWSVAVEFDEQIFQRERANVVVYLGTDLETEVTKSKN